MTAPEPCPFGDAQWCCYCGTEEADLFPFGIGGDGACLGCLALPENAAEGERWRQRVLERHGQMTLIGG